MSTERRTYIAIDLKSFYASVECNERGLDPLDVNLVAADTSRSDKTICLAVSPSLKAYGISSRARLYQVEEAVKKINEKRLYRLCGHPFEGSSISSSELSHHPEYKLDFLAARPRMSLYIDYSTRIYRIYLRWIAPEDIHVYSIDECFIDATDYLKLYHKTAHELARFLIQQVLKETGITATAGIGPNMYLCKCAMDIVAKHIPADKDGVRIAELDEISYRRQLWTHRPLPDFWRVGRGIARRLEKEGIYTMGDVARCSLGGFHDYYNEDLLYRMFGKNAELLIDHAWGYEPVRMQDIRNYQPSDNSKGIGQVLMKGYTFEKGELIVREMADQLSLALVKEDLVTDELVLYIGYDTASLEDESFQGETDTDWYGRTVPRSSHGSISLHMRTSSAHLMRQAMVKLYHRTAKPSLLIRRVNVTALHVRKTSEHDNIPLGSGQTDLFSPSSQKQDDGMKEKLEKEKKAEQAMLAIKQKYGRNAAVKGMDFEEGATTRERNNQIGGHHA